MLKKIFFVKESQNNEEKAPKPDTKIDGLTIAKEYRNLFDETSDHNDGNKDNHNDSVSNNEISNSKKEKACQKNVFKNKAIKPEEIFSICQRGDLESLEQILIRDNSYVNQSDKFGWTPLMIASCAGHLQLVKLLLEHGADQNCFCPSGRSLIELCKKLKKYSVINFLESRKKIPENDNNFSSSFSTNEDFDNTEKITSNDQKFQCEFCGTITGTTLRTHLMSITHQLASRTSSSTSDSKSLGSFAHVSREYKGYQLLRQEGWNGITGLGTNEDGRKYPISVKIRQDRTAIGHPETIETKIEKVLQSQPSSTSESVHSSQRRIPKFKLKHKISNCDKKNRKIAAKFRKSFYDP